VFQVFTASTDGTEQAWYGKSAEHITILPPTSLGVQLTDIGTSIVIHVEDDSSAESGSPNVHSLIPFHIQVQLMIVIPCGRGGFLVSANRRVLRSFDVTNENSVFLATVVRRH
jgi:hypothetical protein